MEPGKGVERSGWAASVASKMQYKMRSGRIARVTQYSISASDLGVNEALTGESVSEEMVQWDANGNCTAVFPPKADFEEIAKGGKPDAQYDLMEQIRGGAK